ncbi:hypothetical protein VTJ83DRAFT_3872 [Remersonia thermophila]|uniref:C2H2-type domain-containing protein n=1 Tax=Remersonia thermophila TaxID=72144 RepID=A0ABR4DFA0_9PEZI
MVTTHYTPQHYGYMPPPSPPMDETTKCSLPSISNLLGLADQGSPTSETSPQSQQQQQQQQQSQQQSPSYKPDSRSDSQYNTNPALIRGGLPPSPPTTSEASFEGFNSPPSRPLSQVSNGSNYYYESTPPLQVEDSRPMNASSAVPRVPVQNASTYPPQFGSSAYMSPPSMSSYYPPMQTAAATQPQVSGLYYQRPLPQVFPPMSLSVGMPPAAGNPWQHHHYIAPSASTSFPQSQDRYICKTCHKAFSRPSSLRIHTHSHTGEKPFKCPFPGCGKAFSVRSNMKRHERGCHNYDSSSASGTPAPAAATTTTTTSTGPSRPLV